MWLPKSKYTVKYARLGEMKRPDGTPYVGPYMEAYNGKCYLGKEFNKNTVELVVESPQESTETETRTLNTKFSPSEEDYKNFYVYRYFRQNRVTKKIEELSEKDYVDLVSAQTYPERYVYEKCVWCIRGPFEDVNYNSGPGLPYKYEGVRSRNQRTMDRLNETLPGIKDVILTDPLEKAVKYLGPITKTLTLD